MIRALLPALFALTAFLMWRSYRDASPEQRKRQLKSMLQTLVVVLVVVFALRSGLVWLAVAVAVVWAVTRLLSPSSRMQPDGDGTQAERRQPTMSRADALSLFELGPNASEAQVQERYKELMRTAHPDQGGDPNLAVKLNQAKDVLTKPGP